MKLLYNNIAYIMNNTWAYDCVCDCVCVLVLMLCSYYLSAVIFHHLWPFLLCSSLSFCCYFSPLSFIRYNLTPFCPFCSCDASCKMVLEVVFIYIYIYCLLMVYMLYYVTSGTDTLFCLSCCLNLFVWVFALNNHFIFWISLWSCMFCFE